MDIGIMGAGTMGAALASRLHRSGHLVLVGARRLDRRWPHPHIALGGYRDALVFGDLTILALPWPASIEVLRGIVVPRGRIIVDVSNPETADGRGLAIGHTTSGAEELSRAAAGARVVKAFSHFYAELLDETVTFDGGTPSVLYCGDDDGAKAVVSKLISSCGLDPVDSGPLAVARYLEPFAMLTVALVRGQGFGPTGAAWRLMRRLHDLDDAAPPLIQTRS